MATAYPHLKNYTAFPGDNVKVYSQYENTFDYGAYTGTLEVKLCSVKWSEDQPHRVCFDSEESRRSYFAGIDGVELTSQINLTPSTTIRVPIPFTSCVKYNYLACTTPPLTGSGDLPYTSDAKKEWYYFIDEVTYISPSTTELVLQLDTWTTFQFDINVERIDLERGHLPTTYTTVTTFLNNPLNNTRGLLYAEPETPPAPVKVSKNNFYPLASSELYAVIAWKTSPARMESLEAATSYSSWGLAWDINTQYLNPSPGYSAPPGGEIIPNGYGLTCFPASELETFCENLSEQWQTGLNYIQAIYLVPKDFIKISSSITRQIAGITHYYVMNQGEQSLANLSFSKSDFGYEDNYVELAKLYTSPYSWISVTNTSGDEVIIGVEDTTGELAISANVSLLYPYLNAFMFLTGVGGNSKTTYQWQGINGALTGSISDTGYTNVLERWEIPCYQLMVATSDKWNAENNSAGVYQAAINAQNAYDNTQRTATTALSNTQDTNATNVANTARTNSTNVANTARTNATNVSNVARSGQNSITNTSFSNDTASDNQQTNYNAALANMTTSINAASQSTEYNNSCATSLTTLANEMSSAVTDLENEIATISMVSEGVTNIVSSTAGGALTGGWVGAAGGAASGVVAAGSASISNMITATGNTAMSGLTQNFNSSKNNITTSTASYQTNLQNATNLTIFNSTWDASNTVVANNNTLATTTTANNVSTANANAAASAATSNTNAEASANTSNTNAQASASTSNSNAARSYNTTMVNAGVILQQAQDQFQAEYRDRRRQITSVCQNTGDATPDALGLRGAQIRVLTQPADVVKRFGDMFCRYGYSCNETIEQPILNIKDKFTYWQGEPIITGAVTNSVRNYIKNLFISGVTFWRDPDEIGGSIYNNG